MQVCQFFSNNSTKKQFFVDTETCTFDSPSEDCHWKNLLSGDEIDWIRQAGSTPSIQTGPSNDHTLKNGNLFDVTFVMYQYLMILMCKVENLILCSVAYVCVLVFLKLTFRGVARTVVMCRHLNKTVGYTESHSSEWG